MEDYEEIAKLGLASFDCKSLKTAVRPDAHTMQANNAKSKGVSLAWNKFGGPKEASGAQCQSNNSRNYEFNLFVVPGLNPFWPLYWSSIYAQ